MELHYSAEEVNGQFILAKGLSLLLGLALCQAKPVRSGTFSVTPVRVVLSAKTPSTHLSLRNDSPEPTRFQLSVFAWDQSPQGETQLTPTGDIVFFPSLLTLAAGEQRQIRVGSTTAFASTEKTYRIFFEELPPLERPQEGPGASQVRVLTTMGIPIFLQPIKPLTQWSVAEMTVRHGQFSFQVKNTGNVYFMAEAVRVTGIGLTGESLFDRQWAGWYVLAGGVRVYDLELPKSACPMLKALAVEVQTEQATFKDRLDMPPGACGE